MLFLEALNGLSAVIVGKSIFCVFFLMLQKWLLKSECDVVHLQWGQKFTVVKYNFIGLQAQSTGHESIKIGKK